MELENKIKIYLKEQISEYDPEFHLVAVTKNATDDTIQVIYHTCFHDDFGQNKEEFPILHYLSTPDICGRLHTLILSSEDEGANGTQNWDLKGIIESKAVFSHLKILQFPLTSEEDHNQKIITYQDSYEENNGIGLLLNQCPQLEQLEIPSAPKGYFFERTIHSLKKLKVQCGYDHQNFIQNLSQATCFNKLEWFFFEDYNQTYIDNYENNCVPFEDYLSLVTTKLLPNLKTIILKDTILSAQQKEDLLMEAKKCSIQLIFQ